MQVINLRTLKPIDRDTIVKSIRKTHRVVSAEEGWPQCGIGAELIAIATEECFDELDAPPERVTGAEVPMPYAANLEAAALPQVRYPPSDQSLMQLQGAKTHQALQCLHSKPVKACRKSTPWHAAALGVLQSNIRCQELVAQDLQCAVVCSCVTFRTACPADCGYQKCRQAVHG